MECVPAEEIEFCDCEIGREEARLYPERLAPRLAVRLSRTFAESGIPERLRGLTLLNLSGELSRGKELAIVAASFFIQLRRLAPDEITRVHPTFQAMLLGVARPAEPRLGLLLSGDNGVGKSAIAAIIAEAMIRSGIAALFIDYHEFIARVQREYREGGDSETVLMTAIDAPLLVLDDLGDSSLGSAGQTANRQEIIYRLVNIRHQRRRLTVVTTNLVEAQIEAQFSRRTWQRLRELCLFVRMSGLNLRDQVIEPSGTKLERTPHHG